MFESFDRVRVCRERCEDIERQVVNLIWLMERNQMRIKSDEIREMVGTFRESAEALGKLVKRFSKFGLLRSWFSRHDLSVKLDKFEQTIYEFCRDLTVAVACNPVSELHEDLRTTLSSIEQAVLQEKIYHERMNPDIDVSTLPADLSLEVRCTNERPIAGSSYWIKQGKWLNREVVALKFPKNFGALECSTWCGGSEDTCEKADRHVPAIKAMEVRDVALGLRYVHSKDVVHAALSPGNVLIRPDGTAAIGDFSRAKIVPADNTTLERTDMSEEAALMRYQAPEEHRAPRPMSKQGDIYAWSMVSLEIISGVQPFPKQTHLSVLYERIFDDKNFPALEEHPSPLWEKHPGLWELIHSCHNLDPLARPNLDDIITKLDECIENEGTSS
ncbi:hypothetical protein FRC05_007005 [Tulasnella sp. 425]|nr:hypothetical protein FRC05_007005 [Tulasnella sp. 425]